GDDYGVGQDAGQRVPHAGGEAVPAADPHGGRAVALDDDVARRGPVIERAPGDLGHRARGAPGNVGQLVRGTRPDQDHVPAGELYRVRAVDGEPARPRGDDMEAGQAPGGERGSPRRMKAVARVHEAAAPGRSDNVRHDVRHRVVNDGTHDRKNTT